MLNTAKKTKYSLFYLYIIFISALIFLKAGFVLAGEATISWQTNTEPDLAGYNIYYGIAPRTDACPPGGYPNRIDVGLTAASSAPSYKLENLEDGKTYYFSVTSYDTEKNESCFSEEMSKAMPAGKLSFLKSIGNFFVYIINFFKNLF